MKNDLCPPEDALSKFVRCHVSEDQAESISEHISDCERCEETVVGMEQAVDTVLGIPTGAPVAFPFQNEPELQRVVQAVKQRSRESSGASPDQPPVPQLEQLRDYRIIEKIGEGGMGAVYRAVHTRLHKTVALKVLSMSRVKDEAAINRFQREMSIVGRLQHPNIVQAHDAGEEAGQHFLVMEYVDGTDLSDVVRQCGPLPINAACEVIAQAAIGLQYAHEHELVHRDIKPSNLMLAQSREQKSQTGPAVMVKILDLGLARLQSDEKEHGPELTMDGQVMGTLDYMAPEQGGNSHSVDIRADIYSLGATLYKLLTGAVPFQGKGQRSLIEKLTALAIETAPSVRDLRPDVPEALAAIIARMLAKRPQDRFATPADVVAALQTYRTGANLPALLGLPDLISDEVPAGTTLLLNPASSVQPPKRRISIARAAKWIFSTAVILVAVIVISTKEGTVEIRTPDGMELKDVKVVIDRDGEKDVQILQSDNHWTAYVAAGKIHLTLQGGQDQFDLKDDTLTVSRWGKTLITLTRKKAVAGVTVAKVEQPESPAKQSEVVKTPQAPLKARAQSASREKPFIVTRQGQRTGEYTSLYGAVSQMSGEDVIEVHANGPIPLTMPEPTSKSLHLRAGKGYRPLLVLKQPIGLHQGLVIEDCDVDQRAGYLGMNGVRSPKPWQFRRCRFWGGGFGYVNAPQLVVEDCIFDTSHGFTVVPSESCQVTVSNCAVRTSLIFLTIQGEQSVPVDVRIIGNTFRFPARGVLLAVPQESKPTVQVAATGNVFEFPLGGQVNGIMASSQWRGQVQWRGQENLYQGNWYREWDKDGKFTEGLDVWNKLWKEPEQNSAEIQPVVFQGARLGDWMSTERVPGIQAAIEQIKTQNQLTRPGPDWTLVGVGDNYVRALAAQGRAVPADRLRPEVHPEGPIVIIRKNVEFKGFLTLTAALEVAETGDVIEIRTDDPIPAINAQGKSRRLTLRAAPGYSPIINGSFFLADDRLIVEGLTFRESLSNSGIPPWSWRGEGPPFPGKGSFERLTNCVFLSTDVVGHWGWHGVLQVWGWFKGEGDQVPEITNCILGSVGAGIPGGKKLLIRNSVLASAWMSVEGKQNPGQLEIIDSVLWTPDPRTVPDVAAVMMSSPLTIASRNSVFALPGDLIGTNNIRENFRGWTGTQNVYIKPNSFVDSIYDGTGAVFTLDELRKSYKTDSDSIELRPLSFDAETWRIWRERSTGYKPREDGTDFGADIGRLAKAITAGTTVKLSKPSAAQPVTTAEADRANPFVLLDPNGKQRAEFKFSAPALAVMQDGETLEVWGNGPFKLPRITREKESIRIRAAKGYRPRFVPAEGVQDGPHSYWVHTTSGSMAIEGCEFYSIPGDIAVLSCHGPRCDVTDCRIIIPNSHMGGAIFCYGQELAVRNSVISSMSAYATISTASKTNVEFTDNIVVAGSTFLQLQPRPDQVVRLTRNKFFKNGVIEISERIAESGIAKIEARDNFFSNSYMITTKDELDLKQHVEWSGEGNIYSPYLSDKLWHSYSAKPITELKSVDDWNAYWGMPNGLKAEESERRGWHYFSESNWETGLQRFQGELTETRQRHPQLKDLGPDLTLVGSGAAYVRVLNLEGPQGRQVELRPDAPEGGPFVLIRKQQIVRGFPTLPEIVPQTQDGDVIEIRSDGPFGVVADSSPADKQLTLRAAAGYRPEFDSLVMGEMGNWNLEGLHFKGHKEFASLICAARRMANCSFGNSPGNQFLVFRKTNEKEATLEIVNCYISGCAVTNSSRVHISNSVIGGTCTQDPEARVELKRSIVWRHSRFEHPCIWPESGKLVEVKVSDCLFDSDSSLLHVNHEIKWLGSRNVYRLVGRCWALSRPKDLPEVWIPTFEDWRKHTQTDADSVADDPVMYNPKKW